MAFYGRETEIAEILSGPRDNLWLIGGRGSGKSSTLRVVEARAPDASFTPLYWDLAGATDLEGLNRGFRGAWESAEGGTLPADDLFAGIRAAARELKRRPSRLLLLCDNAEALIEPVRADPSIPSRLRRALRSADNVRTVLASTVGLWELADEEASTSPFLPGFTPPIYLEPLADEVARRLVPEALGVDIAREICHRCGGHPGLIEAVCERTSESGDLAVAVQELVADADAARGFEADLATLSTLERELLYELDWASASELPAIADELRSEPGEVRAALGRLERLGLVRRDGRTGYRLSNEPFDGWLGRLKRARAEAVSIMLDESVSAKLLGLVYDDLHAQARRYMHRERPGHTLQPTALVNEAYLRLSNQKRVEWQGRTHFLAMGAAMMRRVLVDHARGRNRVKRGGEFLRVTLSDWLSPSDEAGLDPTQLLALDRALGKLAQVHERQARIVEMRFFGGLKVDEVAEALGVSKRTVEGDWSRARAWLNAELSGSPDNA